MSGRPFFGRFLEDSVPVAPFDPARFTPEYLSSLDEEQQKALLEEAKVELGKLQAKVKGQQRESIKRLQKSIARHEAQLAFLTAEARKIDELLASVDSTNPDPEYRKAVRTLTLGKTFFRAGRKMLAIQMQDLRQDLATIATEITAPFEVTDPFSTYEYRRASAEGDLAALQLMMIEYDRSHRVLAASLGMGTHPETEAETPGGGTAMAAPREISRTIKATPAVGGARKAATGSNLALEDGLPPPADLPPVTVKETTIPAADTVEGGGSGAGSATGEGEAAPSLAAPGGAVPGEPAAFEAARADGGLGSPGLAENASTSAAGSAAEEPALAGQAGPLIRDSEEEFDVNYLKELYQKDPEIKRTAMGIAEHLREANGFIRKGLEYMGHIATTPPSEGGKLLELHFWNKVNGKVYYLRRLPDQVRDSILSRLFPATPKPTLPFERPLADGATGPIATVPTDRLGLDD